jgi:hypothetical protein
MMACIESSSGNIECIHGAAFTVNNGRVLNAITREKGIVAAEYKTLFENNVDGM